MDAPVLPDVSVIESGLGGTASDAVDLHVFDKLESTSQWLSEKRQSFDDRLHAGHPQVCITDWQQAGVGRRGKSWQTQPGNVTFSILTRVRSPAQTLLGLSLVTGIAVAEALESGLGLSMMLKWPNDLIHDNRKLGGLLTEIVSVGKSAKADSVSTGTESGDEHTDSEWTDVITGIGVNINHDSRVLALGIGATSLNQAGIVVSQAERDALVGQMCANVLMSHQRFLQHRWVSFEQAWAKRDWLAGKYVSINRDDATERALACGVNEEGALLVESAGKVLPLYGGNVSIRPTT